MYDTCTGIAASVLENHGEIIEKKKKKEKKTNIQ